MSPRAALALATGGNGVKKNRMMVFTTDSAPKPYDTIPSAVPELHGRWVLAQILAGLSNPAVRNVLAECALPCPPASELDRRRRAHRTPPGFSMRPPFNRETEFYLRRLRLDRLALGASEARRAIDIARSPRIREHVETELLLAVPHKVIADMVRDSLGFSITAEAIGSFSDLFFRVELLTRAQLQVAVEDRVRVGLLQAASPQSDPATIARALAGDPRVVAAASHWRADGASS